MLERNKNHELSLKINNLISENESNDDILNSTPIRGFIPCVYLTPIYYEKRNFNNQKIRLYRNC